MISLFWKLFKVQNLQCFPFYRKFSPRDFVACFFSNSFKPNAWEYRWLQKSIEFNGKHQRSVHSKFAKKKCAVASWIRRHSCLKTLLWVRISRNRCELWYSNLNLAKFDAESSWKTVFVYIRPSNEPVNVLFWPRWFQCFLFWEKSWKRWFQWAMIRVFQKLSAPIDDFDDFSEPWFQCAMTVFFDRILSISCSL